MRGCVGKDILGLVAVGDGILAAAQRHVVDMVSGSTPATSTPSAARSSRDLAELARKMLLLIFGDFEARQMRDCARRFGIDHSLDARS